MEYYTILSAVSIITSVALFIPIQQKYGSRNYTYFKLLMMFSVLRSIFPLLELYFDELDIKLLIFLISYLVTASLPVLWFLFSLEYSNLMKHLRRWRMILLWTIPAVTSVLAVTNRFHHLHWSFVEISRAAEGFTFMKYGRGPGLTVFNAYTCLLLVFGICLMLRHLIRERIFTDSVLILPGAFLPFIINILYERGSLPIDYTPVAVLLSVACFAWVILKGFNESQLITAARVNSNIEEGVLFINKRHEVTAINLNAQMIFGLPGVQDKMPAAEAVPFWEKMSFGLKENADEVFEVSSGNPEKWYTVHIRSTGKKDKYPGWLVILSDITEKKRMEEELIQRNKLLTAMAWVTGMFLEDRDCKGAVFEGIKIIGQALKADRAVLYENCYQEWEEDITLQPLFEWNREENKNAKQKASVQGLKLPDCEEIRKPLVSGGLFHKTTGEIESPDIKALFQNDGAVSVLLLPVIINGSFWGIIRFDSFHEEKLCPEREVSVMSTFSHAVSGAIGRGMIEKEVVQEKGKAESASIARSRFLTGISDEIRTPMNNIMGFIELLSQTGLNQEQAAYVRDVASASESLLCFVNDILDYSKIEADNIELESIPFNPGALVEDVIMLLTPKADKKGLDLYPVIHSAVPDEVLGDPGRVRQILVNLIENAVKFTEKGEIVVSLSTAPLDDAAFCRLRFVVSDTGIGIPRQFSGYIFEPFTQADASADRKQSGTGLGLAISKRLAHLMGGKIEVKSEEGMGSEFALTLPVKKCEPATIPSEYTVEGRLKILIADENKKSLKILKEYLAPMNDISEAATVEEVLGLVKTNVFDLIILDCRMKGMDGILQGKQFSLLLPDTRLIITTSAGLKGEARKMKESGFHGYLTKPVRRKELYDCIAAIFGSDGKELEKKLVTRHNVREQNYLKRSRVLLADADEKSRRLTLLLLKKAGIAAETAENGNEAIAACARKKYDLIFIDCRMPVMNEYKTAATIRENSGLNSGTPIVAMIAGTQAGGNGKHTGAGADDYLSAPITRQKLEEVLKRFFILPNAPQVEIEAPH